MPTKATLLNSEGFILKSNRLQLLPMRLQSHIVAGVIGTAVAYPFLGPEKSALFFTASVLIDADHYLDYLWRTRGVDWSPARMFRYYEFIMTQKEYKNVLGFSLLHTAEAFLAIYALGYFVSPAFFFPIILGMAYHMVFDIVSMTYKGIPFERAFSIVEYFIRKHSLAKKGIDINNFYKKAFEVSSN